MNQTKIAAAVAALRAYDKATNEASTAFKTLGNSMAAVFVPGMAYAEYSESATAWKAEYSKGGASAEAAQKAFERALRDMNAHLRAIEAEEFAIPKADNAKAQKQAASREEAKKKNAEVLSLLLQKAGLSNESATADSILAYVAKDQNLTLANKELLTNEAIKRGKAEMKAKQDESNKADKAVRDEIKDLLDNLHGAQLAKALAALKKIK